MTEIVFTSVFYEVAALLVLTSVVGFLGLALRQPLIVSFILVGILAGPLGFGLAASGEHIELLAELGVAVLLFLVGLKLDLHLIRSIGSVALTTGIGQVLFTSVIGFAICLGLGMSPVTSLYVAVALTFSSTIIIVKLLSDKREIDSLHGRIALGFLIVQDLVVVLAMVVLSAFGVGTATEKPILDILLVVVHGLVLMGAIGLFIRYAAEPLLRRLARTPELLLVFAIGWAALLAALGDYWGFSKELGGLLAGVSLASTPYRESIASRLSSLRDFLLLFFFIGLGAQLDLRGLGDQVAAASVLSLFVLIGNPLIVMIIMGVMGYRKRTGFLAGLTVAQISEFSLIFMAMGLALGHVNAQAVSLVTMVGLATIALSTYMITYSQTLYLWIERFLGPFERKIAYREAADDAVEAGQRFDVILFGIGRYGEAIAQRLQDNGLTVLGVDFDPEAVRDRQSRGLHTSYGDAMDPDISLALPLRKAQWVIAAVPGHRTGLTHDDPRLTLLGTLRAHGFAGKVAVTADTMKDADLLRSRGADLVLMPFRDAADQAVDLLLGRQRRPAAPEPIATAVESEGQGKTL